MNELLSGTAQRDTDPAGSLVDADMGAWYTWINLQRLNGADQSAFVAWFEGMSKPLPLGRRSRREQKKTRLPLTIGHFRQDRTGTVGLIKQSDRIVSAISGCSKWNPAFSVAAGITRKLVNRNSAISPKIRAHGEFRSRQRCGSVQRCDRVHSVNCEFVNGCGLLPFNTPSIAVLSAANRNSFTRSST